MIKFANFFRKKYKCFDHIISLGYNCEVAYKFLKYFKFEESNLFNWAYCQSIQDLIYALSNINEIGNGDFDLPKPLWECKNTHILFHGKENIELYKNNLVTNEIIEKDKRELKERIAYLKNKFLNILRDDSYKLYIYKIRDNELNNENIKVLQDTLNNLGANNYKLLVVCQKSALIYNNIDLKDKNIMLRNVIEFASDNDVTNRKYKRNGWNKIFDEFYCNKNKNYKYKKYKFDKKEKK